MRIFNEDKTAELTEVDLESGYLKDDELVTHHDAEIIHHDAVEAVEEQSHYETIAEYPNGGKDIRKVIDVEAVEPKEAYDEIIKEAYDEREPIQIYIPYTEEVLKRMKAQRLHSELQAYLSDTDYAVIKCGELKLDLETEYPGLSEKRAQARAKINELESEYAELWATKTDHSIIV